MIHKDELTALLRAFHEASGFRLSLHDASQHELAAYPPTQSKFCACIQNRHQLLCRCYESDSSAAEAARESGKPVIYRCHMGLYEAVNPIIKDGVLLGFLMMGQVLDDNPRSVESARDRLVQHGVSPMTAKDVTGLLPRLSRGSMEAFASIMTACTAYLAMSDLLKSNGASPAEAAHHYMENHYAEKVTIDGLCQSFHCCRATMTASYKKKYGETINEALNRIRLEKARELLGEGKSISAVAAATGFSDTSYFSKCYRRRYGHPPGKASE